MSKVCVVMLQDGRDNNAVYKNSEVIWQNAWVTTDPDEDGSRQVCIRLDKETDVLSPGAVVVVKKTRKFVPLCGTIPLWEVLDEQ